MATEFFITDDAGRRLNAKLEQDDRGIVLHSRSGPDRNREYREALEAILARLSAANAAYDVYLDSAPVKAHPLSQRRLAVSNAGSPTERFNALVRAMNLGSSSNGAWRRILITAPSMSSGELARLVRGQTVGRLPALNLRAVTDQHIDQAVRALLAGQDATNFAPSRDFDVLAPDGSRLAPKKVFGLALSLATGIDAGPEHFTAGLGTPCFKALEAAGYPIVRKDQNEPQAPIHPDMAAAEGSPKLVTHLQRERKPALAAAKRRAMIDQLGYLQCERCHLIPSNELGTHGDAVIEVHHATTQISEMTRDHVTRLSDLQCLCANCHRIVHRELAA